MRIKLCLLALALLTLSGCNRPKAVTIFPINNAAFTALHGTNALQRIERLVKISPRDSGTAGAAYASQWIARELREIGLKPVADTWVEPTANGSMTFSNIHAELPGRSNSLVIIGSHFDTKSGICEDFQGANDGGSSTGLLLELAAFLKTHESLHHTIRFAFFDGEECITTYRINDGLHGSRRMATQVAARLGDQPVTAVVIIDMVGDQDLKLEIPRNVTPWLAKVALDAAVAAGYPRLTIARGSMIDDHWPFLERGMPVVNLIDFEYGSAPGKNDYWHSPHDTIDKLSTESLTTTGRIVLEILARLEADAVGDTSVGTTTN